MFTRWGGVCVSWREQQRGGVRWPNGGYAQGPPRRPPPGHCSPGAGSCPRGDGHSGNVTFRGKNANNRTKAIHLTSACPQE